MWFWALWELDADLKLEVQEVYWSEIWRIANANRGKELRKRLVTEPWCGSDTWQEKDRTGEWERRPVMQIWQSPRQLNGEPQTKDWPLEESLIGQKWPGPSSSTDHSHWLGASQEKSNLGLNIVVSFERTTARRCHLTSLLSTEWRVLSWRKIWVAHLPGCHI